MCGFEMSCMERFLLFFVYGLEGSKITYIRRTEANPHSSVYFQLDFFLFSREEPDTLICGPERLRVTCKGLGCAEACAYALLDGIPPINARCFWSGTYGKPAVRLRHLQVDHVTTCVSVIRVNMPPTSPPNHLTPCNLLPFITEIPRRSRIRKRQEHSHPFLILLILRVLLR